MSFSNCSDGREISSSHWTSFPATTTFRSEPYLGADHPAYLDIECAPSRRRFGQPLTHTRCTWRLPQTMKRDVPATRDYSPTRSRKPNGSHSATRQTADSSSGAVAFNARSPQWSVGAPGRAEPADPENHRQTKTNSTCRSSRKTWSGSKPVRKGARKGVRKGEKGSDP